MSTSEHPSSGPSAQPPIPAPADPIARLEQDIDRLRDRIAALTRSVADLESASRERSSRLASAPLTQAEYPPPIPTATAPYGPPAPVPTATPPYGPPPPGPPRHPQFAPPFPAYPYPAYPYPADPGRPGPYSPTPWPAWPAGPPGAPAPLGYGPPPPGRPGPEAFGPPEPTVGYAPIVEAPYTSAPLRQERAATGNSVGAASEPAPTEPGLAAEPARPEPQGEPIDQRPAKAPGTAPTEAPFGAPLPSPPQAPSIEPTPPTPTRTAPARPLAPAAPGVAPERPLPPRPMPAGALRPRIPRPGAPTPPPISAPLAASPAVPARWLVGEAGIPPMHPEFDHSWHENPYESAEEGGGEVSEITVCFEPIVDVSAMDQLELRLGAIAAVSSSEVKRIGHGRATLTITTRDVEALRRRLGSTEVADLFSDRGAIWHVTLAAGGGGSSEG